MCVGVCCDVTQFCHCFRCSLLSNGRARGVCVRVVMIVGRWTVACAGDAGREWEHFFVCLFIVDWRIAYCRALVAVESTGASRWATSEHSQVKSGGGWTTGDSAATS